MIRRSKSKRSKTSKQEVAPLIRTNTVTLYGLYFATSNTDFLLDEKETRFSVRPDVILKKDRQTAIFDYSAIKGSEQGSIFDGFFRGLTLGGTGCQGGVTLGCTGSTLGLAGAITTTCNFINEITGIPKTDFADTYTLSTVDVASKTIVAIKDTPITSTTAVQFNGDYFIDLPQWTKTQKNQISTPVKKIINLLSSQSLEHLGIRRGSVLEFKKTKNNNKKFTVVNMYNENGFEILEVDEEITKEDATDIQVIVSVYGEEPPLQGSSAPPVLILPERSPYVDFNDCCPCKDCLLTAIRRVRDRNNNGCENDGGPYGLTPQGNTCKNKKASICQQGIGGYVPPCTEGQNLNQACCDLCDSNICQQLATPCAPDDDLCCRIKKENSELLIACEWRRWGNNPNTNCECDGRDPSSPDTPCCDCKNLALIFLTQCARDVGIGPGGMSPLIPEWEEVQKEMEKLCNWNRRERTCIEDPSPPVQSGG